MTDPPPCGRRCSGGKFCHPEFLTSTGALSRPIFQHNKDEVAKKRRLGVLWYKCKESLKDSLHHSVGAAYHCLMNDLTKRCGALPDSQGWNSPLLSDSPGDHQRVRGEHRSQSSVTQTSSPTPGRASLSTAAH